MLKTNLCVAISAALLSTSALADTSIERIEIIGNQTDFAVTNPITTQTLLENILPTQAFAVGGIGGFAGFNERGTKSNHTVVYRNGVPVNDAGAGWYDFGHDIATGNESIAVRSGPQGTLYGSASMGGTVFINDTLTPGALAKVGNGSYTLSVTPLDFLNITHSDIDNGSVRSDNDETDTYENTTVRVQSDDLGYGFVATLAYTDYTYEYDNCSDAAWTPSNDCVQEGVRTTLSIRNENITFGYNSNDAEYYTNGDYLNYESDAENFYFDARERFVLSEQLAVVAGVTATREEYIGETANQTETYALLQYGNTLDAGVRYTGDATVGRVGLSKYGFTVSASSSYRNPNLYELNGDGVWVMGNPDLEPEEGRGVEIAYGGLSVFKYKFDQGIDYEWSVGGYVNTGEYETQGVRYTQSYDVFGGELDVFAGYTDTELSGTPKRKANIGYTRNIGEFTVHVDYTLQQDRGADWSGAEYDDVRTADVFVSYSVTPRIDVTVGIEDLFDREFEVAPGYGAGGREFGLTVTYR